VKSTKELLQEARRISRDSDPLYKQRDKKRTSISYRDRKEHKKDRKG
jgi:hypothetical protein